ncbi:MAG: hypothetical protein U5M51_03300 [Emticicia sp.]|nr:hypothetical protein [Emticicia sp.]
MKKILLILSLFSAFGGFAQGDFTRIYHPIINSAELAIVDTNYYEALDYYKAAFDNVKKPFAKDYYNAAICAAMVGKMPIMFDYLEKIVEKGYPSDSLRKDAFFKYVADTSKVWTKFESQMRLIKPNINWAIRDSLKAYYESIKSTPYTPLTAGLRSYYRENIKELQDIVIVEGREMPYQQVIFPDSLISFKNLPQKLKSQQDSIRDINYNKYAENARIAVQKTVDLIWENGFPDETMIGLSGIDGIIEDKKRPFFANEYNFNDLMLNNSLVNLILGSTSTVYGDEIISGFTQLIRDGKFIPHHFKSVNPQKFNPVTKKFESTADYYLTDRVQVLQLQMDSNIVCENTKKIENHIFWKKSKFIDYSEAEINEKRLDIGLETLADAYKKAFFKAHPRVFIINGGTYQTELSYVSSCEVLEKMLKESTFTR